MSRKVIFTLAVALMVVLAGCSALGDSIQTPAPEGENPDQSGTRTADASNDNTNEQASVNYPKGVTKNSVNMEALFNAHTSSLLKSSFTVSHKETTTITADGSTSTTNSTYLFKTEGEKSLMTYSEDGKQVRARYMNGSYIFKKNLNNYAAENRTAAPAERIGSFYVVPFLASAEYNVDGTVKQDGETLIKLTVAGISNKKPIQQYYGNAQVKDLTGEVLVDEQGIIHEMNFDVVVQTESGKMTTELTRKVAKLGSTSVSVPSWKSEAVKKLGAYKFNIVSNNSVAVTPTQDPIKKGSTLYFYEEKTGQSQVTLDATVEAGETLYLYLENGQLRASKTAPGDNAASISYYSISALGSDGSDLFTHSGSSGHDHSSHEH